MRLVTDANQYSFEVDRYANKREVAFAVENMFKVKVRKVQTQVRPGKVKRVLGTRRMGRRSARKIAVVTLPKEQRIGLFEESLKEE